MMLVKSFSVIFSIILFVCVSLISGQITFGIGTPNNGQGLQLNLGGRPQDGRQTIGGLVNNFLGGLFGRPAQGGNNQNQNQFGRPIFSFGGFDPCRNNGGCEHNCQRIGQRRRCQCKEGYVLRNDFRSCVDVDECSLNNKPCQDNCINTPGSFHCTCGHQAILLPDKRSCIPKPTQPPPQITPAPPNNQLCSHNNGGCEDRCVERRGKAICKCGKGYKLNSDKKTCRDIDECATDKHNCGSASLCDNTIGSFTCQSPPDPQPPPIAVPSCDVDNGGCEQRCRTDNKGRAICICRRNFKLRQDGLTCELSGDPCSRNNGRCQHKCIVKNGKKKCLCDEGFKLVNGRRCQQVPSPAVDPCQRNNVRCQHTCRNEQGTAVCECQAGYKLVEARRCQLIQQDVCAAANCEHNCLVSANRPQCYCNPGYFLYQGRRCFKEQPLILPGGPPPSPPTTATTAAPITAKPTLPSVENCGVNPAKSLIRRIVGGKPANPKDWPWMAALLKKTDTNSFCGGVLIAPDLILTAAHCVAMFNKDEIKVRLGEYDFSDGDKSSTSIDSKILDIRIHEKYNTNSQKNDIAIIKLETPINFNPNIFPICLPEKGVDHTGQRGYVVGWGTIYFGGPISTRLQEVIIPVWEEEKCEAAYEGKIKRGMMCAGVPEGGMDSCQGDSGGPYMMQRFPSPKWFVAGVVSWGIECASPNRPGVYTKVANYLDWIASHSY